MGNQHSARIALGAVASLAMVTTAATPALAAAPAPAPAAAVTPAAVPAGFVRHEMRHWTWYGPGNWIAAEGANDLYVVSPTGTSFLHYGASAAPCASPAAFFAYVRRGYMNAATANLDLYSFGLTKARYVSVGAITTLRPYYYRQTSTFDGQRPGGKVIRGELVIDYFYAGAGACGERMQVRSAPAQGIVASLATLRKVQTYIFGPR